MRFPRQLRPSPAMIVACVALVAALAGTGMAAVSVLLPPNSVGSAQVIDFSLMKHDFRSDQLPAGPQGAAGPAGPQGASGPTGPSDAYVRGFPANRFSLATGAPFTTLAEVAIPQAGNYVIWAKAYLTGSNTVITCQLVAGDDTDTSSASSTAGAAGTTGFPGTISNLVAHTYGGSGVADFQCQLNSGAVAVNNVQVVAVRVGNLTKAEGDVP